MLGLLYVIADKSSNQNGPKHSPRPILTTCVMESNMDVTG